MSVTSEFYKLVPFTGWKLSIRRPAELESRILESVLEELLPVHKSYVVALFNYIPVKNILLPTHSFQHITAYPIDCPVMKYCSSSEAPNQLECPYSCEAN
jgi:hypothetical protein